MEAPDGRPAQVLARGEDLVLVGCGTLLGKAVEAGKALAAQGIEPLVGDMAALEEALKETSGKALLTDRPLDSPQKEQASQP